MDDRQRIEALVTEGRITRDEADELLMALDDIAGLEEELAGSEATSRGDVEDFGTDSEHWDQPPRPTTPPVPPVPPFHAQEVVQPEPQPGLGSAGGPTAPRPSAHEGRDRDELPEGYRWLEVKLLAGDLDIEVSGEVSSPLVNSKGPGGVKLEKTDRGWRLTTESGFDERSILGKIVRRVAPMDAKLTLPEETAVRLQMTAGDVNIRGPIEFLSGNMVAGDLEVEETHGIDMSVRAGDVDVGVRVEEGRHRLTSVAGDLNVRVLPGTDAIVKGSVNIGELRVKGDWERHSRGLGSSVEHKLGEGRGELVIQLGTGDLELGVERG